MLILILGDTHIPSRAVWIPKKIESFILSKKFDYVFCTGDLTDLKVLNFLKSLGNTLAVKGNMDHLSLPEYAEIEVGDLKVGIIHGDQVYPRGDREQLKRICLNKRLDVLISGHTHSPDFYRSEVTLLNPGSATGVWGGGGGSLKASFMILNTEGFVELYELEKDLKRRLFEL
ncbi:MAG: metallophosphoesterase [Archaeoglobaceae archaeon]|nr:metallophosphoesterase [Archaeoglobaceae archaeon]MCX8152215.1 metallophosphoesterase [Archaeoglobaceae archaeon]MDW8014001.1 metallophosphoesterase [Archaeoglobaceae archaeon]